MKYEKAVAEVIDLVKWNEFMATSVNPGKRHCNVYSYINGSYHCFNIVYTERQEGYAEEVTCNDITPGPSPQTIWCSNIWDYTNWDV